MPTKTTPITVRLLNEDKTKTAALQTYVVNSDGQVIESAPFTGLDSTLTSTADTLRGQTKVYIGPALPKNIPLNTITERTLLKGGAYQPVKNIAGNMLSIARLPAGIYNPWQFNNCLITGHVSKNFNIDGQQKTLPVCHARVHICEVETEFIFPHIPILYKTIPDWLINELSQKIINYHINPVIVKPKPIPDPIGPVINPLMDFQSKIQLTNLKANLALSTLGDKITVGDTNIAVRPVPGGLNPLPAPMLTTLSSGNAALIKQTIIANHQLFYPYICLWPKYWEWFYTYDEDTIVYTDCNGHFEMWENTLTEDGPLNIYIWVEVCINGIWTTVYKPPVPCNTYWSYKCGSEISVTVTDPRVGPCDCNQLPGEAVWFRSIGESATALHTEQNDASSVVVQGGASISNVGCSDLADGHKICPYGGDLYFKMHFGSGFPSAGVTHYRWKKTQIKDANLGSIVSPSTSIVLGEVRRYYYVEVVVGLETHFETHSIILGPEGTGDNTAYKIPHWDIMAEPLVPAADKLLHPQWTSADFWSAYIDSNSLNNGLWKFELELLKPDGGGTFQVISVPKATFQVSDVNNSMNSVNAPDTLLNIDGGNVSHALSLTYKVRIDNAFCTAHINDVMLADGHGNLVLDGGQPIRSGRCGFIRYTSTSQAARLSFVASQPRNFATFSYYVIKGNNTEGTGVSPSGYVISSVGGFTLSVDTFTDDVTVAQLLGTCPGQAAFSENLGVYALATNGTRRLYEYDRYDVNAFALSNT